MSQIDRSPDFNGFLLRFPFHLRTSRSAANSFWTEGRDKQFHFDGFRKGVAPHFHVIAGWNDMFLLQSLDDFVEEAQLGGMKIDFETLHDAAGVKKLLVDGGWKRICFARSLPDLCVCVAP